jgi:squalene-hopene/tetraprenyl-beta-curcumene cyclase
MSALTRRAWLKAAAVSPAALAASGGLHPRLATAAPTADDLKPVVDKALGYLKGAQTANGDFNPKGGEPGLTALTVAALLRNGVPADHEVVAKGVGYLEKHVKPSGGVYQDEGQANYMTCLALMTFKELNAGGKYDKVIEAATKYVKGLQNDTDPKGLDHGGVGYSGPKRPDLSNTHFLVEALLAAGVPKDDPAIKKALVYVSRTQNLKSPKLTAEGGLRSEGGMTYAGLKSFLYAGVSKDDPRVKAAIAWVKAHYSVTENPGQGQSGLYYYYHTFAKAMDALGEEPFVDAKGAEHDWRQELFDELKRKQKADGSWKNDNPAFLEGVPQLATAFALLSLSYCKKK